MWLRLLRSCHSANAPINRSREDRRPRSALALGRVKSRVTSCLCFSFWWALKAEQNITPITLPSASPLLLATHTCTLTHTHAHARARSHRCAHTLICNTSMSKALPHFRKKEHGVWRAGSLLWPCNLASCTHSSRHAGCSFWGVWGTPSPGFWARWCLWPPWSRSLSPSPLFAQLGSSRSPGLSLNVT